MISPRGFAVLGQIQKDSGACPRTKTSFSQQQQQQSGSVRATAEVATINTASHACHRDDVSIETTATMTPSPKTSSALTATSTATISESNPTTSQSIAGVPLVEKATAWLSLSLPRASSCVATAQSSAPASSMDNATASIVVAVSTTTSTMSTCSKSRDSSHPLEIPMRKSRPAHGGRSRRPRPTDVHSPHALPAAVSALLAVTDIPRHHSRSPAPLARKRRRGSMRSSTSVPTPVTSPLVSVFGSEKDFALLGSPLELLLSPSGMDDDEESRIGSCPGLSPTLSVESMSSLCDSLSLCTDAVSIDTASMADSTRSCRFRPLRQEREALASPVDDPLAAPHHDDCEDDDEDEKEQTAEDPDEVRNRIEEYLGRTMRPFKSAFRSNLTASLRVIKWAAREISTLKMTSIPPEDFLIQGFRPMDPKVPYTDERRPPVLKETPPPALRRYLNPTTTARIVEPRARSKGLPSAVPMQTYKIERPRSSSLTPPPASMRRRDHLPPTPAPASQPAAVPLPPAIRPREPRENPEFIRIAVLEMAMRRAGKLDEKSPGRARWALPPRKCSNRPYAIGADGVPERWIPLSVE